MLNICLDSANVERSTILMNSAIAITDQLGEAVAEVFLALNIIFRLGFIPKHGDIKELDDELYAIYVDTTGDTTRP